LLEKIQKIDKESNVETKVNIIL